MEWDFVGLSAALFVNHNTVIQWVKRVGEQLPNAPEDNDIPELAQIDELQTFVGAKKTKSGCGLR